MTAPDQQRPSAPATLEHVHEVLDALDASGLSPCLFGGWAKELHGVWEHGAHGDIDILVRADDIAALDAFLRAGSLPEFLPKRHVHKRAYWHRGILVELFHLRPAPDGTTTDFYGQFVRPWRSPLACTLQASDGRRIEVATADNIIAYERDHPRIQDAFYAAFPAIRAEIEQRYGDLRMPYRKFFPAA